MVEQKHKHYWLQVESDYLGKPTKYICVLCPLIYHVVRLKSINDWKKDRMDTLNSLTNKIAENIQKISFIELNPIGTNEKLHINHLQKEIVQLNKLLQQYKVI